MRRFEIIVDQPSAQRVERVSLEAPGVSSLFGWAARHAAGRRFEVFEDGASLGGAAYDEAADLWTIFPPSHGTTAG